MEEKEKTSPRVVGEVTVKINIDASELDAAIEKAKTLQKLMSEIDQKEWERE